MSMDTVENLLDIPIDYYIRVNMEGFKDIVDAVGGIRLIIILHSAMEDTVLQKDSLI